MQRLKRKALAEALRAKLAAMLDREESSERQKPGRMEKNDTENDDIDRVFKRLSRLVDTRQTDYIISRARQEAREGR